MNERENLLVVSVDRDNDFGRKAGVQGPIVGRQNCIKAGVKLLLADPTDSDSNSAFGAVKKYDEVALQANAEVAILTGVGKTGFESDRKVAAQLDAVLGKFPATGIVLVTDGAEDDQVIPILQGRAPIVSKETIIVSQANEVEGAYFTIKNALNDPDFARTFILVPGIVVMVWSILASMGLANLFFTSMGFIVGIYLILKGTGIESRLVAAVRSVTGSLSLQRVSLPVYIMMIILFFIGILSAYQESTNPAAAIGPRASNAAGQVLLYLMLVSVFFVIGKSVDAVQLKKAYYIRKYFLSGAAALILWFILDSARLVIAAAPYAGLAWLAGRALMGFVAGYAAYKFSKALDLRRKITKLLVGLPVYSSDGKWLGIVKAIGKESIEFEGRKQAKPSKLKRGEFMLSEGKIVVV